MNNAPLLMPNNTANSQQNTHATVATHFNLSATLVQAKLYAIF